MHQRSLGFWLAIGALSSGAGILFVTTVHSGRPVVGAVFGLSIGLVLAGYEIGPVLSRLHRWIRSQATPVFIAASLAVYVVLILVGNTLGALLLWTFGLLPDPLHEALTPPRFSVLYSLAISLLFAFVLRIRDLIGAELFRALLLGRYHRPVSEERVFLFVDLVGSTSFADRHGDYRAQEYLGEFFALLAGPVRRHRGSIDDYVGDMALVSWPLARGVADAACLRCVFGLADAIATQAADVRARFGEVPRFRAALHAGPVVTAEIGLDRHKIAFFGDAVNTTARLEALSKQLAVDVIASRDLLDRIGPLPESLRAVDLGPQALRGRAEPLVCFAVERATAALRLAA